MRLWVEKQQPNIERKRRFQGTTDHVHLPAKFHQRELCGLSGKIAADFIQEVTHQLAGEVFDSRSLIESVVERDAVLHSQSAPSEIPNYDQQHSVADSAR